MKKAKLSLAISEEMLSLVVLNIQQIYTISDELIRINMYIIVPDVNQNNKTWASEKLNLYLYKQTFFFIWQFDN